MKLYRPEDPLDLTANGVQDYLLNVLTELVEIDFSARERSMQDKMMFGRLLDERTRPFFFYHFTPLLQKAVEVFFSQKEDPLIVELGCGSGSASILFGLLGAKVVGIDQDANLINACRKRQAFYEKLFGALDIRFHAADVFNFDYEDLAPLDGIYSLFALHLMQPSRGLLSSVIPTLGPGGKLVVSDGNPSAIFNALFRRGAAPKPREMADQLCALGCKVISLKYDCIIPPRLVKSKQLFPLAVKGEKALHTMGLMRWLGVSYTVIAEKT